MWHDGKEHKDFWKLIDDEDSMSMKAWRMHWKIYKGNKLLWKKLPPDFILFGKIPYGTRQRVYESVTGKKFTYLGFLKYYTSIQYEDITKLCKVRKHLFARTYNEILYTDNCFSWKKLNTDSLNLSNDNYLVTIENYNERLLIYSAYKIAIYDCDTDETKDIYTSNNKMYVGSAIQYDSKVACIGDTAIVMARTDSNLRRNTGLLVFKNDKLVKSFKDEMLVYSVAKNKDRFWMVAQSHISGIIYSDFTLFFSKNGLSWDKVAESDFDLVYVFIHQDEIFLIDDYGNIYKYSNGDIIRVENNVRANLEEIGTGRGFFIISAKDYIYANDFNRNLIRFRNFDDDTHEILIEDYNAVAGIYAENWEG